VLKAAVVERYSDALPVMVGPDGVKPGLELPPTVPLRGVAGARRDGSRPRVALRSMQRYLSSAWALLNGSAHAAGPPVVLGMSSRRVH
jgi:hypothetical protein